MANTNPDRIRLSAREAHEIGQRAMRSLGFDEEEAWIVTDHCVDAALCGYEYSGMAKLLNVADHYMAERTPPTVIRDSGVGALMDGGHNTGMLAIYRATEEAIRRAQAHGMGMVVVNKSWVSGRGAYYMEMITRNGLVGFHTAGGSNCRVAAPGSVTPAIGTNPIAFGFPTQGDPLILDMGTSAIMGTDLYYRARLGIPIPDDVALDKDGNPTTDAQAAVDGTILPFGGYKGFGLGLMVHAMNLLGSGKGSKGFSNGYMVMAIKPDLFLPVDEYRALLSQEIDRIKKTEKRAGFPEIRLPGERGFRERRKHLEQGIEIDRLIYDKLLALGARSPD